MYVPWRLIKQRKLVKLGKCDQIVSVFVEAVLVPTTLQQFCAGRPRTGRTSTWGPMFTPG